MAGSSRTLRAGVATFAAIAVFAAPLSSSVQAQDIFSLLFGGFGPRRHAPPVYQMPFDDESVVPMQTPRAPPSYGEGQAYCVRTCDGRYFPLSGSDSQSKATLCSNLCPSSTTEVIYGSDIEDATTENGTAYAELPNAFRYRNEIVAGCTCNGKDQFGLARVNVENDPTIRSGDIVAGAGGLVVASRGSNRRHASVNFSPLPEKLRARFRHVPIVAKQ
jgi:uncharacterized protein DUF2865